LSRITEIIADLAASAGAYGTDNAWLDLGRMGRASRVGDMVVKSGGLADLMRLLVRLSAHQTTVLVQGESGTGKELVARAIHDLRSVPRGPFVTFNCSNLVESLAESQLFGHVKGAFTDAREDSQGYFRAADGGVLFLDEIGEMPLGLQAKLLRAVEYREIHPVGSTRTYKVNVQIVAATNRDLRVAVKEGRFRADLFYRLNVAAVVVPPLRQRIEAIDALVSFFVERCNRELAAGVRFISRRAMERLLAYEWPGNVRELENAIRYAALVCDGDRIDLADLPQDIASSAASQASASAAPGLLPEQPTSGLTSSAPFRRGPADAPASLDDLTREAVLSALRHARGNRQRAARILGVSRTTLYRMLVRYGLSSFGREDEDASEPRTGALRLVK
jgi:DNA-binding NtrC family response regulator